MTDAQPQEEAGPEVTDPRRAVGVLALGLLLLLASFVCVRLLIPIERHLDPTIGGELRLRSMLSEMDKIPTRSGRPIIVMGTSHVVYSFDCDLFDRTIDTPADPTVTYNLATIGINPEFQLQLAKKVRAAFERSGKKIALSLLEFAPDNATYAKNGDEYLLARSRQLRALLWSPEEMLHSERPVAELLRYGVDHHYWSTLYPEDLRGSLSKVLYTEPSWWFGWKKPLTTDRQRASSEFARTIMARFGSRMEEWRPSTRGFQKVDYPEIAPFYERMKTRSDERMQEDIDYRAQNEDAVELHLDPRLVTFFIQTVLEMKKVSAQTQVFVHPVNRTWEKRPPEAIARVEQALARILAETGVSLIDLSDLPGIDASEFADTTHLNSTSGAAKLTRALALRVKPAL